MTMANLCSDNYTIRVRDERTLAEIAQRQNLSLERLVAANPSVSLEERLHRDQRIFLPMIQQMFEGEHVSIPETIDNEQLEDYRHALFVLFTDVNDNDQHCLNLFEFKQFLVRLQLRTLTDEDICDIYLNLSGHEAEPVTFERLYGYFHRLIVMEKDLNESQWKLFQSMLIADHLNECLLGGVTRFVNRTWSQFGHFRRYSPSGQLVMSSEENIAQINAGKYSLLDLICWPDQLTETHVPAHVVVRNFRWRSKGELGVDANVGELIFPADFDGRIPTEIGSIPNLKYYGCTFANETQLKVSLIHEHEIADFKYAENYLTDFVVPVSQPSLERHAFAHLDCPHESFDRNGRFILGKIVGDHDELHLTAFLIPARHTLYVPPFTIHSNDYLRGTWRTMLAGEDIDRVLLKRSNQQGTATELLLLKFS